MPDGWPSFPAQFILHTLESVRHGLTSGSAQVDLVAHIIKMEGSLALPCSKPLPSVRDKPVIRCENCTKSPEQIGRNAKFMLCSVCMSKLDFVVHYCSR